MITYNNFIAATGTVRNSRNIDSAQIVYRHFYIRFKITFFLFNEYTFNLQANEGFFSIMVNAIEGRTSGFYFH